MSTYEKKGYLTQEFRIFRLNDAKLREIPFHYHDFHKIIFFLSGSVDYTIEGITYPLEPRDIVFVSAGEIHRPLVKDTAPYERIVIYVSPSLFMRYQSERTDLEECFRVARKHSSVMHVPEDSSHDLLYHLEKLEKTAHEQEFAHELYTEILFVEYMILLNRALITHEMKTTHEASYDEKIQSLLRYIHEHLMEELTIDELAEKSFLSKYYLMRRFKSETGYSIHQYINNKRLMTARSLLDGTSPITEICYQCGFRDYTTFSRAFQHMFKMSPTQYREQHQMPSLTNSIREE